MPITIIKGMTTIGLAPSRSKAAEATLVSAMTPPTDRSIPPVMMTSVMPMDTINKAGIVNEQIEEHLRLLHGRINPAGDKVGDDKDRDRRQQGRVVEDELLDPLRRAAGLSA